MKKVLSVIAIAALSASFVACGPSAEEEAAAKAKADSLLNAMTGAFAAAADTAAAAVVADTTTAAVATETAVATEKK